MTISLLKVFQLSLGPAVLSIRPAVLCRVQNHIVTVFDKKEQGEFRSMSGENLRGLLQGISEKLEAGEMLRNS